MAKNDFANRTVRPDDPSEAEVRQVLIKTGLIIPDTADDVAMVENLHETDISGELPESLQTTDKLMSLLNRSVAPRTTPFIDDTSMDQGELGRAARFGQRVSPEIEKLMTEDRDRAEREMDGLSS